jgi:hypothetical protein
MCGLDWLDKGNAPLHNDNSAGRNFCLCRNLPFPLMKFLTSEVQN